MHDVSKLLIEVHCRTCKTPTLLEAHTQTETHELMQCPDILAKYPNSEIVAQDLFSGKSGRTT